MVQKWDAEAERRLFLAFLASHGKDVKFDYQLLADTFGEGVTRKAMERKLQKLKEQSRTFTPGARPSGTQNGDDDQSNDSKGESDGAAKPNRSKKRKREAGEKVRGGAGRRKQKTVSKEEDEDEDA